MDNLYCCRVKSETLQKQKRNCVSFCRNFFVCLFSWCILSCFNEHYEKEQE
ncbi:unnamed protein product [Larinioides sclopetarius]|uniref:Uncharacterized protein n=1 Tax=Larinioides sclopetarius TaxID=280406 RepID=A0AAV1ZEW4_9ARAC